MREPLVSIIITTFKRHDYLERAINSALNQDYPNIEVIVVDDNSVDTEFTNQVKGLVTELAKADPRLVYLSMGGNYGACRARNAGFAYSNGEYVDFLDDDDTFEPDKISLQVKKFNEINNEAAMIGCFASIRNDDGEIIQYERTPVRGNVFFRNLCRSMCQTSIPLIRRDVFDASGGFEDIPSSQEHLMLARVFDVNPQYDYVEKELVNIYHHSGDRISNGRKKTEGAKILARKFERYYSKLSEEQILELKLAMNANIINANILVGNKSEAKIYYKERKMIRKRMCLEDFKLLIGIFFGSEFRKSVHRIISKFS